MHQISVISDALWKEVTAGSSDDEVVDTSLQCITSLCALIAKSPTSKASAWAQFGDPLVSKCAKQVNTCAVIFCWAVPVSFFFFSLFSFFPLLQLSNFTRATNSLSVKAQRRIREFRNWTLFWFLDNDNYHRTLAVPNSTCYCVASG